MSDTPKTDANVASLTKAPDCFCDADHARRLERQRDAYAATLRVIAESNDRSHHDTAYSAFIRERQ